MNAGKSKYIELKEQDKIGVFGKNKSGF